jgi:hypothetical protein
LAKKESYIDKIVYKYNFDPLVTEASTESNSEWTNPNIVIKDNDNDNNDINNDNNNGGE